MVDGRGGPDAGVVLCGRGSDSKTKLVAWPAAAVVEIWCHDWFGLQPAAAAGNWQGRTSPAAAVGPVGPALTAFGAGGRIPARTIRRGPRRRGGSPRVWERDSSAWMVVSSERGCPITGPNHQFGLSERGDRQFAGPNPAGGGDIYLCGGGAPPARDSTPRRVPSLARMIAQEWDPGVVKPASHATWIIGCEKWCSPGGERCTRQNLFGEPIPTGARRLRSHAGGSGLRDWDDRRQHEETSGMIPRSSAPDGGGGRGGAMQWPGGGVAVWMAEWPTGTGGACS
ncbi:hypothetical protein CNMCM8980_006943 [Aspergillus fumigatiaffinis]|nr:hypothetical protein CNMCM8980_006943 [Aspergillus fumigatiaffinis]